MTITLLLKKYNLEAETKAIYSILSNNKMSDQEKLVFLGEEYSPRLDFIKADLLIKLYKKIQLTI